jgi:hypothetical protein
LIQNLLTGSVVAFGYAGQVDRIVFRDFQRVNKFKRFVSRQDAKTQSLRNILGVSSQNGANILKAICPAFLPGYLLISSWRLGGLARNPPFARYRG